MITSSKAIDSKIRRRRITLVLAVIGTIMSIAGNTAGQRYALLVGVGTYADTQNPKLALKGPPNDVQAMQRALKLWGFDRITVLQDAQATRAAILKALDALVKDAEKGSHVLFYFSGHGTIVIPYNFHNI